MKQATGKTNLPDRRNKVSIQLKLSGHSFSLEVPSAGIPEECAVYTARTLLLPRDEFDAAQAELCLRLSLIHI